MDNTFSLIVNDILASHPQIKKELYEAIDNKNVGFLLLDERKLRNFSSKMNFILL